MTNLQVLDKICWQVTGDPTNEAYLCNAEIDIPPLMWKTMVLPGHRFTLVYPIKIGFEDIGEVDVPYDPEKMPVLVEDILETIYQFYKERLGPQDYRSSPHDEIRSDTLGELIQFTGLERAGQNRYRVKIELR